MAAYEADPEMTEKARNLQERILNTIAEDSSQYDTRDVGKVKKDLWYCSKFVKQVKGNEEVAYDRMVGV
jgi:hypothetical protein